TVAAVGPFVVFRFPLDPREQLQPLRVRQPQPQRARARGAGIEVPRVRTTHAWMLRSPGPACKPTGPCIDAIAPPLKRGARIERPGVTSEAGRIPSPASGEGIELHPRRRSSNPAATIISPAVAGSGAGSPT